MTATAVAIRERPLLMSGPMVRAVLDGRKTQTRRVVTLPKWIAARGGLLDEGRVDPGLGGGAYLKVPLHDDHTVHRVRCPYGEIGDRLWVRESHWFDIREPDGLVIYADGKTHRYKCDGAERPCEAGITPEYLRRHEFWRQRPSIFMPRWASRITLEITEVRVERLQSMSVADARAEGITEYGEGFSKEGDDVWRNRSSVENYASLWDSLNAKRGYGWDANPWVWVLEFKRVTP